MTGTINIRDANAADAPDVAQMANALTMITEGSPGPMTPELVVSDLIEGAGLRLIVAERGTVMIGYALYSVAYEIAYAARGLYVSDIYVEAGHRRSGAGRALMAELARRCRTDGGRFLWWISKPGNAAAGDFYDRIGAIRDEMHARAIFGTAFDMLAEG
jgi:ribosomal protein S18 acetylase RimI-like enzyme